LDTWTTPTGALLANAAPGGSVSVGDSFDCMVINQSGGVLTLAAGASVTITNSTADLTMADNEVATLRFVCITATAGSEAWFAMLNKSDA